MSSDDAAPAPPATLADQVDAAVRAVPGVVDLHGGFLGEVATYLPGRRVAGVRLAEDATHVHVVLAWDAPIGATTDAVRDAVRGLVQGPGHEVVHVMVEDVAGPERS